MGYSLKKTVCVTRLPSCPACLLYRSCLFPYFFETPPDPEAQKMRRYQNAPHPFVLSPDREGQEAGYVLGFVLVGKANTHLPVFVHALARAAESERGVMGHHFRLILVAQEDLQEGGWRDIYSPGGNLNSSPASCVPVPSAPRGCKIRFVSPLRVKREGRRAGPKDLQFADFFVNVLRRVSMLVSHHAGRSLEADFRGLKAEASKVAWRAELSWKELGRYSSRQKTAMRMGGVIGWAELQGVDLEPFWPFLWVGQWLHAGSGATMGLGRYRLSALP